MRVLIVDDDFVDRTHLKRILQKGEPDCHITESETVREGLAQFRDKTFDLVLLDYKLPEMDGIEMLKQLRADGTLGTAIVMLSNSENEELALDCIRAGAHDFMLKADITPTRLKRVIVNAQSRFQLEDELKKSYERARQLARSSDFNEETDEETLENSLKAFVASAQNEELLETNKQLALAKNVAEAANKAKSEFLASMSHEIRTPLNGVIAMLEVLQHSSLQPHQVEMVDLVNDSAFALLSIIDDILDFSKIEADKVELEKAPFSLVEVIERACDLLDKLAIKQGVEITVFTDPEIPENLLGDSLRLRQVLLNLGNNAIKFCTENGLVSIRANLHTKVEDVWTVDICVTDNGIGIDDATQSKLFNAFQQADTSTTRLYGGTGLGLVISRNLVELMGGEILVESSPGVGSVFTLRIPFTLETDSEVNRSETYDLSNISTVVIGRHDGLTDDMARYLTFFGADVQRYTDVSSAAESVGDPAQSLRVFIIDAAYEQPPIDRLDAVGRSQGDTGSRYVMVERRQQEQSLKGPRYLIIERGRRRTSRVEKGGIVKIDGNVLHRDYFLQAVLTAVERINPTDVDSEVANKQETFSGVSVPQDCKILVAEDYEANQRVILYQLEQLGYKADVASDGEEALNYLRKGNYAALLTDLHMPNLDGYDLARQIRSEETGEKRLPIIAMTANTLKGEEQRCIKLGMDGYLSKPARLKDINAILERFISASNESTEPHKDELPAEVPPIDVNVL